MFKHLGIQSAPVICSLLPFFCKNGTSFYFFFAHTYVQYMQSLPNLGPRDLCKLRITYGIAQLGSGTPNIPEFYCFLTEILFSREKAECLSEGNIPGGWGWVANVGTTCTNTSAPHLNNVTLPETLGKSAINYKTHRLLQKNSFEQFPNDF